jgi:hypothetical protein
MKPGFRSAVKDLVHKRTGEDFNSFNAFQRSQWTTRAFVEEILQLTNPGSVPDDAEDLEHCFADGPSDAGVDFFYRTDGHVLIIQAKYRSEGKVEEQEDFNFFCDVLTRLHPVAGRQYKLSSQIREMAADIDWDNDTFDLQFISIAKGTENIRAREKTGQSIVSWTKGLEDRVEITFSDENDLNLRYREAESASQEIAQPIKLLFTSVDDQPPWIWHRNKKGRISYIGYVNAGQLRNLYDKQRYRLFSQNIRNYVGDTSTNKGIIKSAIDESQNFFFFNNGISAISSRITPLNEESSLLCERFSIINGAQTIRSLAKAHAKNAANAGQAYLLVRITESTMRHEEEEEVFLDSITRFNNTQNAVKVSDFRSNDAIQRGLAKKFSTLSRGGKQYWYKNKRTGDPNPRKIAIGMEELVKAIHSFWYCPHDAHGGMAYLFGTGKDEGYMKVFGADGVLPTTLSDDLFASIAGVWFLTEKARELMVAEKENLGKGKNEQDRAYIQHALERRWMLFFVIGELLRSRYRLAGRKLEEEIRHLSKPKWLDESNWPAKAIGRYVRSACEILIKNYRTASKDANFIHRNWFRAKDTLENLRDDVEYSSAIIEALPLLRGDNA